MRRYAVLLLALFFLSGCCGLSYKQLADLFSSNETGGVDIGNVFSTQPEWTYMVYMDGDNNLEQAAVMDFLEMEYGGGSSDKVNIVVQMDRSEGFFTGEGDWSGARRFLVKGGGGEQISTVATEDLGRIDMGSPGTLYDFVSWAVEKYPAKKYALVLWNHGGGWTGMSSSGS